jgi:hypothetical protein
VPVHHAVRHRGQRATDCGQRQLLRILRRLTATQGADSTRPQRRGTNISNTLPASHQRTCQGPVAACSARRLQHIDSRQRCASKAGSRLPPNPFSSVSS